MGLRSSFVLAAKVSAGLLLVASLIAVGARSAAAATCVPWFGTQPAAVGGTNNSLTAVASVSPCDAWAVGNYFAGGQQSFIHHWDGTAWEQTPNPNPGTNPTVLNGVAAVSVSD